MQVLVVDSNPASRASVLGRVQEAIRQAEIRRVELVEAELEILDQFDGSLIVGCLLGPSCYPQIEEIIPELRIAFPAALIGLVLENDVYAIDAVSLRKRFDVNVMPMGDLAQIAGFVIDCEEVLSGGGQRHKGVIGFSQFKGGVGTTTLTAAFASCFVKHGFTIACVDLDDVNPQLTDWARVGVAQRTVTSEFLRQGEVPPSRINEILHPVEGFEGKLVVVGQPERYNESFHYKADILDGSPSSSDFMFSLLEGLRNEFDAVLVDMGRSWGVSSFATLPMCQHLLLVTDDDGMSVRRTLDGLKRFVKESDDPEEFDLTRWSLVLNAYTGRLISPKDLADEIGEMELLPPESNLFTLPFSEIGRQWGAPGKTLYELADDRTKYVIRKIAYSLIPFRYEATEEALVSKLLKKWQSLINAA